jgi:hypothetical protein
LFNIALEGVIRRSKVDISESIFSKEMQSFANDVDIVGRNLRVVTDTYSKLEVQANKIGLQINEEKTKFLMMCESERTKTKVGDYLEFGNKKFKVADEFIYRFINA